MRGKGHRSSENGERFPPNGERFSENGERFSENGERFSASEHSLGAGRHRSGAGRPRSRAGEPPARMNDVRAGKYRAGDEKQPSPSHIPCAKGVLAHPGPEMPSPVLHTKPVESNGDTVGSDGHPGGYQSGIPVDTNRASRWGRRRRL